MTLLKNISEPNAYCFDAFLSFRRKSRHSTTFRRERTETAKDKKPRDKAKEDDGVTSFRSAI